MQKVFREVSKLPRRSKTTVVEIVPALVDRYKRRAG
jgi:hypothetical protein